MRHEQLYLNDILEAMDAIAAFVDSMDGNTL